MRLRLPKGRSRRADPGDRGVTEEHVRWAYRLFLDRPPESDDAVAVKTAACPTTGDLRRSFLASPEFAVKNPGMGAFSRRIVVIAELEGGLRLFVDLADTEIGLPVVLGEYEPSELRFVRSTVRPGDRVLDVGANIGFFTVVLAAQVGAAGFVHAFEPLSTNADLLVRSVAENGFAGRVSVERAAVGERTGQSHLLSLATPGGSGGSYLVPTGTEPPPDHAVEPVPLVALDDLDLRRPVAFLKIDAEGAEPLCFAGAERLLREDRPVVLSELHQVQLERVAATSARATIAAMERRGYACRLLEDGRPGAAIDDLPENAIASVVFLPE
jgi:FkbM family methyltransferase